MSNQESKFLEIVDLKKGFGSGETRQEVLRGMNFLNTHRVLRSLCRLSSIGRYLTKTRMHLMDFFQIPK